MILWNIVWIFAWYLKLNWAKTLSVVPSSNTCVDGAVFPSISCALQFALSNDIISLSSGVYSGSLNTNICFGGSCSQKNLTLSGSPYSEGLSEIDCQGTNRGLEILDGNFGLVNDVVIKNCYSFISIPSFVAPFGGSGLLVINSSVTLRNIVFRNNSAIEGGAVMLAQNSTAFIDNCQFEYNYASIEGGAISIVSSSARILGSMFSKNWASTVLLGNSAGKGGAIYYFNVRQKSFLHIYNCSYMDNYADVAGGGIFVQSVLPEENTFILRDSTLQNNYLTGSGTCSSTTTCNLQGGGAYLSVVSAEISGTEFIGNHIVIASSSEVSQGGAIFSTNIFDNKGLIKRDSYGLFVTQCSFVDNNSSNYGGALYVFNQKLHLNDSSFVRNVAGSKAYIFSDLASSGGAIWYSVDSLRSFIANCTFDQNKVIGGWGGGLFITSSSKRINIHNCQFWNNVALSSYSFMAQGGALMVSHDSTAYISSTSFINNTVGPRSDVSPLTFSGAGGAIYVQSAALNISSCYFERNLAMTGQFDSGSTGGAILLEDVYPSAIMSCTFIFNGASGYFGLSSYASSGSGGAIMLKFSSSIIENCNFIENWVTVGGTQESSGGAIAAFFGYSLPRDYGIKVTNCNFVNNSALTSACQSPSSKPGQGGAIAVVGVSNNIFEITRCNFTSNIAYGPVQTVIMSFGGAIAISLSSNVTIFFSNFVQNQAIHGIGDDISSIAGDSPISNSLLTVDSFFEALSSTGSTINAKLAASMSSSICTMVNQVRAIIVSGRQLLENSVEEELTMVSNSISEFSRMCESRGNSSSCHRLVKSFQEYQLELQQMTQFQEEGVVSDVSSHSNNRKLRIKLTSEVVVPAILIGNGIANFVNPTFSGIYYLFIGDIGELIPTVSTETLFTENICSANIFGEISVDDKSGLVLSIVHSSASVANTPFSNIMLKEVHVINGTLFVSNNVTVEGNSTLVDASIRAISSTLMIASLPSRFITNVQPSFTFYGPVFTGLGLSGGQTSFYLSDDDFFSNTFDEYSAILSIYYCTLIIANNFQMTTPFVDSEIVSPGCQILLYDNSSIVVTSTGSLNIMAKTLVASMESPKALAVRNEGNIRLLGDPYKKILISRASSRPVTILDSSASNSLDSPFSVYGSFIQTPQGSIHVILNSSYQETPILSLTSNESFLGNLYVSFTGNPSVSYYDSSVSSKWVLATFHEIASSSQGGVNIAMDGSGMAFSSSMAFVNHSWVESLVVSSISCEYLLSYSKLQPSSQSMYDCSICLMNTSCNYCNGMCTLAGSCPSDTQIYSDTCCPNDCGPYGTCTSDFRCDCNQYFTGDSCSNLSTLTILLIASGVFVIVVALITLFYYRYSKDQKSQVLEEIRQGLLLNTDNSAADPEYIRAMQQALILKDVFVKFEEIKIEDQIGEGSFGVVYKATFRGAQVAVKQMRSMFMEITDNDIEEFRKEAYMMSRLRHPNIVLVMGISLMDQEPSQHPPKRGSQTKSIDEERSRYLSTGGTNSSEKSKTLPKTICIITEYLEQGSLADILYGPTRLPAEVWSYELILTCALQAARGMLYLHSHSPPICHRDLKSSNLVVDDHWVVKVTDFGMSRIVPERVQDFEKGLDVSDATMELSRDSLARLSNSSNVSSFLRPGARDGSRMSVFNPEMTSNLGTTAWCAPELLTASSKTRYSIKVDVYSYGLVLWELWEKKRPFEEFNSRFDIVDAIRAGKRPPISDNCPPAYRSLMQRCWQAEPARRPTFQYIVRYLKDELARVKRQRNVPNSHLSQSLDLSRTFLPTFLSSNDGPVSLPDDTESIPQLRLSLSSRYSAGGGPGDLGPAIPAQRSSNPTSARNSINNPNQPSSNQTSFSSNDRSSISSLWGGGGGGANGANAAAPVNNGNRSKPIAVQDGIDPVTGALLPNGRSPLVAAFDRSLSHLALSPNVSIDNSYSPSHDPISDIVMQKAVANQGNTNNGGSGGIWNTGNKKNNTWRDRYVLKFSGWKASQPDTGLPPSLAPTSGNTSSSSSTLSSSAAHTSFNPMQSNPSRPVSNNNGVTSNASNNSNSKGASSSSTANTTAGNGTGFFGSKKSFSSSNRSNRSSSPSSRGEMTTSNAMLLEDDMFALDGDEPSSAARSSQSSNNSQRSVTVVPVHNSGTGSGSFARDPEYWMTAGDFHQEGRYYHPDGQMRPDGEDVAEIRRKRRSSSFS